MPADCFGNVCKRYNEMVRHITEWCVKYDVFDIDNIDKMRKHFYFNNQT